MTRGKLKFVLKWFKKDKTLGLDGWVVEFCLAFFDLIRHDLLKVIEECWVNHGMYDALNTTCIPLS